MNPDISIIIPLYNEVDNIEPLGYSIINAMQGRNYEVVFVDDGSADGSTQKLRGMVCPTYKFSHHLLQEKCRSNGGHGCRLQACTREIRGFYGCRYAE